MCGKYFVKFISSCTEASNCQDLKKTSADNITTTHVQYLVHEWSDL